MEEYIIEKYGLELEDMINDIAIKTVGPYCLTLNLSAGEVTISIK